MYITYIIVYSSDVRGSASPVRIVNAPCSDVRAWSGYMKGMYVHICISYVIDMYYIYVYIEREM